eukprot:TRINITY_DN45082_c0_g1_i1.p1 TRINITY_DN45082_c0_g1~~TRINITY_DN45082_c0_g1_i1.p1  ORF type:complete len:233 (-),score=44.40 TRINITY_DN45082_c0_g1_i1:114-812(-)
MFNCCCTTEDQNEFRPIPSAGYTSEKYPAEEPGSMMAELSVPAAPAASTSKPAVFEVDLDMSSGNPLGILLDNADEDFGPMIKDVAGVGSVALYNANCSPECKIETFDRIESVNGKSSSIFGKSSEEELRLASEGSKLSLVIRKPQRRAINIDKSSGKAMGVNMTYKKASVGIVVKSIDSHGLIADWNAANPECTVMIGDRIVGMNGEDVKSSELIAMMKSRTKFNLEIMSY